MPSIVEEFEFIARRANEIRAARYHELGVSPPESAGRSRPPIEQAARSPDHRGGFRYAPGFEHLAEAPPSPDEWDCCLSS